jgi:ribosomal protein S18 acetylase RimI-like enzyme
VIDSGKDFNCEGAMELSRIITDDELDAWYACPKKGNETNYVDWVSKEQKWIEDHEIKTHNMFIFEKDGKFLGKLCIFHEDKEHLLFLTPVIGYQYEKKQIATSLFLFTIQEAKYRKNKRVDAIIDDYSEDFNEFIGTLQTTGFKINRRKILYKKDLTEAIEIKHLPKSFSMKTIGEIGREKFTQLFIDCTEGSLNNVEDLYPTSAESLYKEACEGEVTKKELWRIFSEDENPVAFVLPTKVTDSLGTIEYIGTLPECRGRGLSTIFLQKGLEILKSKGATEYLGSTALSNKPMIRVFEKSGCSKSMSRVELIYQIE